MDIVALVVTIQRALAQACGHECGLVRRLAAAMCAGLRRGCGGLCYN